MYRRYSVRLMDPFMSMSMVRKRSRRLSTVSVSPKVSAAKGVRGTGCALFLLTKKFVRQKLIQFIASVTLEVVQLDERVCADPNILAFVR